MDSIRVELPLPPSALMPNSRPTWRKKATAISQYRGSAKLASFVAVGVDREQFEAAQFPWIRATAQVFWSYSRIQPDRDNVIAALKSAFDGIADSGVIGDDRELIHLPVQLQKVKQIDAGVTIVVSKVDETRCPMCHKNLKEI